MLPIVSPPRQTLSYKFEFAYLFPDQKQRCETETQTKAKRRSRIIFNLSDRLLSIFYFRMQLTRQMGE